MEQPKRQQWAANAWRQVKRGASWLWLVTKNGWRGLWLETWQGVKAAAALIRQSPWQPMLAIAVLSLLPTLLGFQAQLAALQRQSRYLAGFDLFSATQSMTDGALVGSPLQGALSLLQMLVLTPFLYAVLARVQLSRLWGEPRSALAAARGKAAQWRALLPVMLVCLVLTRLLAFFPNAVRGVLNLGVALFAWVPLLGPVLSFVVGLLLQLLSALALYALNHGIYWAWLAQEDIGVGAPVTTVLLAAWQSLRARWRPLLGWFLLLTLVSLPLSWASAWLLLSGPGASGLIWLFPLLEAGLLLLSTSYIAVLYAGQTAARANESFTPPEDFDRMKRADSLE